MELTRPVFASRAHAGRLLADHLSLGAVCRFDLAIVIRHGGVPVYSEIERLIPAFAEGSISVHVQRVFHPTEPSVAVGAVTAGSSWFHADLLSLFPAVPTDLEAATASARDRLVDRHGEEAPWPEQVAALRPRSVAIVDDVIATGSSMAAVCAEVAVLASVESVACIAPVAFSPACDLLTQPGRAVHSLVLGPSAEPFHGRSYFADLVDAADDQGPVVEGDRA